MARDAAVKEREAPAPAVKIKAEQQLDLPNIEAAPAPAPAAEKSDRQKARDAAQQSLMQRISNKVEHKPPRIFLYGVHGIGKSTFGAEAPSPIFIPTEEGVDEIGVAKFPTAKSSGDVLNALRSLYSQPHDFKTVAIDTADWLEDFIAAEVRNDYEVKELAYGKDNVYVTQRMYDVLVALTMLRDKRNMATILIAHCEVKRFDSPLTDPYDRYQPKLVKGVSALVQEWADACLFATYEVTTKKVGESFGQEKRRGISDGTRMMYTEERPGYVCKNRYSLPHELPLSFAKLAQHIPYYSSTAAQKGK